nr:hypothetical protein [Tanacetum cinerariifolium]
MYTIQAQQQALDDALVTPTDRIKIEKCNLRLIFTLKSKEATLQVVLDALKLTRFYKAFEITTNVPEIYMQEFWATNSINHASLRFKMNGKSHTVNVENFRDMLQICPKLPSQIFKDPPFEKEILSFIRDLGYTEEIKCLSGDTTGHDSLCLSRAQIIWGIYHNKNVDYVYLLWEDLVYQVENNKFKKNIDMCYPRFTKVIIDYIMKKDLSIPKRNKMSWHTGDDLMFTTIRVISKHQTIQIYGAILPKKLTNQAMIESEAYKTYNAYATMKRLQNQNMCKRKLHLKHLLRRSLHKLLKANESKLQLRSKTQFHSSQASSSGAHKGTSFIPRVLNVPSYGSDDEQISWKSSDDEDDDDQDDDNVDDEYDDGQDDDNEQTESDNDGDDFAHPKFSTFDEEEEEEKLDEEKINKDEVNELYNDVNINLEGIDTKMEDALLPNVQATQVIKDTHVIMTDVTPAARQQSSSVSSGFISNMLNPDPNTCMDFILNLNTESTSLVDVLVTTNIEIPPSSVTTFPLPPIPLIQPQKQTPVPKPAIVLTNLFELELKKILIDKIESNKSIHRSDQQETLYKALIDAYEIDKVILDTYGDTVTFKRRRDDEDDDEEPSADQTEGSKSHQKSTGKSAQADEPIHTAEDLEETAPQEFNTELLVGPTFELMKGSCKSLVELEYFLEQVSKVITDQLAWNNLEGQQYLHDLRKPLPLIPNSQGRRVIPFDHFINNDLAYLKGGVKSYQKKLNLTRPDTYRSDLKRLPIYSAYTNPRGFIYQNKDKKNKLMRINKLHKFSDGTLTDVRTALDDILKRIRIKERYAIECGNKEMMRRRIINGYLPTFVHRLHQSVKYKRSLGEVFSRAVDTFMEEYKKLFDKRYPYVDKVVRAYLLDPIGLQNVMPDGTGRTPGQGPLDTPTASYA